jgi:antitoxin YefM
MAGAASPLGRARAAAPHSPSEFSIGTEILDFVRNHLDISTLYSYKFLYNDLLSTRVGMSHVSYSAFRQHLAEYMDEVCDSRATLRVTRQNARTVVLLSEEEYEGMMETLHLLRSPANAKRLLRSIKKADTGKLIEREID